jgi:hypothetical protein
VLSCNLPGIDADRLPQLCQPPLHHPPAGFFTNAQLFGDLLVGHTSATQGQDLAVPLGRRQRSGAGVLVDLDRVGQLMTVSCSLCRTGKQQDKAQPEC